MLSAKNKNYCLDVSGGTFKNGTPVGIWKKHGGINQQWVYENGFLLCAANKQFCLDIDSSNGKNGSKIQIWSNLDGVNQRWRMINEGQLEKESSWKKTFIINNANNKAIDIPAQRDRNGQVVHMWTRHGELNQLWYFKKGRIHSALNPSYCLDIYGPTYENGSLVHLWQQHEGPLSNGFMKMATLNAKPIHLFALIWMRITKGMAEKFRFGLLWIIPIKNGF